MQINVAKNTLTGESSVLSTPDVPLEDFHQNTGLKVYDDVQKCVCASRDQNGVSELSANEVEHLTHDQETLTHTQFSYTPCYIPAIDYISEEEQYRPPSYQPNRQTGNRHRVPFPLTGDDPPYTILSILDTAEPITAIFMGFQSALDESCNMKKSHGHIPKPSPSNGAAAHMQGLGDGHRERAVGPGIRKIWKKQQPCCSVC
uniref:Uncharacterized protein n=1 Tax=Oreochromis niloticus TaxID=8128 RepID=A0A669BIB5_ORENI